MGPLKEKPLNAQKPKMREQRLIFSFLSDQSKHADRETTSIHAGTLLDSVQCNSYILQNLYSRAGHQHKSHIHNL